MSRFYVYTHKLDGEVIYVGSGNKGRPYNMTNRSRWWKIKVGNRRKDVKVGIYSKHNKRQLAYRNEEILICKYQPVCNMDNVNYSFRSGGQYMMPVNYIRNIEILSKLSILHGVKP